MSLPPLRRTLALLRRLSLLSWMLSAMAGQALAEPAAKEAAVATAPAPVKLRGKVVFSVAQGQDGKSAIARAALAGEALKRAVSAGDGEDVRVERRGDAASIYAGRTLVATLVPSDAGGTSLDAYAATAAVAVRKAVHEERERSELADVVFSVSLAIFLGLCALYAWRRIGEFVDSARDWTEQHPDRLPGIRLQSFEVVGPAALRGGVQLALFVARWFLQLGVGYLWLIFTLSRFDATQPYTARLTSFVLTPLSELAARLVAALPLGFMAVVSGVAIYVILRFVRLVSISVARGDTKVTWLPAEFARSASVLFSLALIVTALLFVAPVVTGDADGALARSGAIAMLALGLSCTPLLAAGLIGTLLVFGRGLRVGQRIEMLAHQGQVRAINLLDLRLALEDGSELRVPHLVSLWHPLRILGSQERLTVELSVAAGANYVEASEILLSAARGLGKDPSVELIDLDAGGARYRVAISVERDKSESDLRVALWEALDKARIALGPARPLSLAVSPR